MAYDCSLNVVVKGQLKTHHVDVVPVFRNVDVALDERWLVLLAALSSLCPINLAVVLVSAVLMLTEALHMQIAIIHHYSLYIQFVNSSGQFFNIPDNDETVETGGVESNAAGLGGR